MATRLRLPASGSSAVSPSFQSYSHADATTRRALPTSDASALGNVAQTPDAADHLVAGDTFHSQFVSEPLAAGIAFVTSDTVKYAIQCLEANGGNNLFVQLHIRVVDEAGTTEQAVLLTKSLDGTELPTSLNCRTASHNLTGNYTTVRGDRLVVEFSVSGTPTAAGGTQGHNATLRWGSDGAGGDLAENESQTGTTLNPWIEFSRTLSFSTNVLAGLGELLVTAFAATVIATSGVNVLAGTGVATATGFAPVVVAPGALLFDASSTGPGDRINFGAGGNRDDLMTTGQTLLASIHRPGSDTGNAFLITKQDAFTGGWAWMLSGTTPSVLRLIVGRATAHKDVEATEANACVADQHEIAVTTFDSALSDGQGGVRHYRAALNARLAEVSAYTVTDAGSGALGGDSTADLLIGNWDFANAPYDGDRQVDAILHKSGTTPYTLAECRRVQVGLLIVKRGHEESDAAKVAFGKAMIESVATAVLLQVVDANKRVTDYSDNAYTGTVSGTTVGTNDTGFRAPLRYHNDTEPQDTAYAQEQDDFWYHSGGANVRFDTEATAGAVFAFRNGLVGYDPQANVGLVVDGAWNSALTCADQGANVPSFSGLSAGAKEIQLVGAGRGRPPSLVAPDPAEGTYITVFWFNAPATEIAPVAPSKGVVVLSESIFEGYIANPLQQLGVMYRVRLAGDGGIDGVTFMGWGGYRIRLEGGDSDGIDNLVAQAIAGDPDTIVIAIGVNDYTDAVYTLAQFKARVKALTDALLAEGSFTGRIRLIGPIINDNGFEANNAQGYDLDDVRSTYDDIATETANSRLTSHNAKTVVDVADLTDGTHPDNDGHLDLYNWVVPILVGPNVLPGTGVVTATGFAPTVTTSAGTNVLAGTGELTATGFAPTVTATDHQNVLAGVGAATFTGFAPTVSTPVNVLAGVGAVTADGFAPTVQAGASVLAGVGELTATGFAATVDVTAHQNLLAGTGEVSATGFAPTVTAPANVLAGVGVATFAGFAPTIQAGANVAAGVGQVDATGFAPTVTATAHVFVEPGVGVVTANGFAPTVVATAHQFVLAGTGALTATGFAPIVFATDPQTVLAGVGVAVFTGLQASVATAPAVAVAPQGRHATQQMKVHMKLLDTPASVEKQLAAHNKLLDV